NEWLHIAATYDGNTSRVFVNGIEDASASFGPLNIGTASGGLSIGAYGTIQRFKGSLDDLRLYGRALNGSEISSLANPNQTLRMIGTIKEKGIVNESSLETIIPEDYPVGLQTVVGLFPNPVDYEINLKFSGYDSAVLQIAVFDARGVRMKEGEFEVNNGLLTMDISPWKLKPGVHIIVINNNGQQQILKFIKK
ncbi:LamG-like jellyroll fold domain-containing protein, partial [Aquiflexum sp.]|uniref:LamG-like jellyroll fold domain-containing protein n=1 Tax=Aquiflexum sp. TaxID=1872584 RepID=UPI003594892A